MTHCPACGAGASRRAFVASTSFRRCRSCATLWDPEPPGEEGLSAIYSGPEYFVKEGSTGGETLCGYPGDYLENAANIEAKFEEVLGHVERYVPPGKLLDVGAGPGFLVRVARERGWESVGVDLNEWAVRHARSELGVDVRQGSLGQQGFGEGEFEAVTMMDLIEHLPAPGEAIAEAARIMRVDGCAAILTPNAGSLPTRLLGSRWPEVRRPGEHVVLFSVAGLSRLLRRHGLVACGWHSVGKTASLRTLVADVSPVAPDLASRIGRAMEGWPLGQHEIEFDPGTKFCLYARRAAGGKRTPAHLPARIKKTPEAQSSVEGAILTELRHLADAREYCDWLFSWFADAVHGEVAEVGAGIGTFSERILNRGANHLLLIEPEDSCARELERRFAGDGRVTLSRDQLPAAATLEPESFDLVVCQNVLEHITEDAEAVSAMGRALREGGLLALIVPAIPRLFGPLDEAYGHRRRYAKADLGRQVEAAGLQVQELRFMNAPGIGAWWLKNLRAGARVGPGSLRAYERVVRLARPLEARFEPARGLSLVCLATKPHSPGLAGNAA